MRNYVLSCLALCSVLRLCAQQEPGYTKYMFNTLAYNPGYAGSHDHLAVSALYRSQWMNWGAAQGAPITQTVSIHSPWRKRIGLGLSLVNDAIGARGTTSAQLVYAYRIPFGDATLALGLQGGVLSYRANWDKLSYRDPQSNDAAFNQGNINEILPTFGAGVYFYAPKFYLGLSVPTLLEWKLRQRLSTEEGLRIGQLYRHLYVAAGAALPLQGEDLVFKPSILVKTAGLLSAGNQTNGQPVQSPITFDVDLSLLFFQKLWVGGAFRSSFNAFNNAEFTGIDPLDPHDSADLWAAFYLSQQLRIGASYDFTLSKMQSVGGNSFEVVIGYDLHKKISKVQSPRYFF